MSWRHFSDKITVAYKTHKCRVCGREIQRDRQHVARRGVHDGESPITIRFHFECEKISRDWKPDDWENDITWRRSTGAVRLSHNNHTSDLTNQDLTNGRDLAYYLKLTEGWEDPLGPLPLVTERIDSNRIVQVVRDDVIEVGTKGRFGDLLVQRAKEDTLVYVQPRCGFAGMSLTYLAKKYNKRLVLFSPASREPSLHQRWCWEQGADMRFVRVAAMPNLGLIARKWAEAHGALFIPLGLRHELVTAAGVRVAYDSAHRWGYQPRRLWSAISTGVLHRSLQIAWPDTQFISVAVARNIKSGERGRAEIISHDQQFNQDARLMPPYPSASNYDAKVWEHVLAGAESGDFVWNVAGQVECVTTQLSHPISSQKDWGDLSDCTKSTR